MKLWGDAVVKTVTILNSALKEVYFFQVIQGYERGIPGMCKGEKRVLIVPPHLGYGDRGVPGVIPGGATLRFEVELLRIREGSMNKEKNKNVEL